MHADLKSSLIDLEVSNITTGGKQDVTSVQPERLSERNNIYCVYWIGSPEHNNLFLEGYIGITSNLEARIKSHSYNKKKTRFTSAISKYGITNLIIKVLHNDLSLEESLKLEEFYRPTQNIGWNLQKGGKLGVEKEWYTIKENKDKHSLNTSIGTKKAILEKDSKENRANRARLCWDRGVYLDCSKGSKNPKAILNEEQVLHIKCNLLKQNLKLVEIAKLYNVKPHVISFIKTNKNWKHVVCDSPDPEEKC